MGEEQAFPSGCWERWFLRDEQGRWLILAGPPWRRRAFVTPSRAWRDAAARKLRRLVVLTMGGVAGSVLVLRSQLLASGRPDALVMTLLIAATTGIAGAVVIHFWSAHVVLRGLDPAPMPPRELLREWNLRRVQSMPAWAIWSGLAMVVPLLVASLWMLALGIDLERFWPLGAESAAPIATGFPARTFVFGGALATLGAVVAIGALGRLLILRSRAEGSERGRPGRPLSGP